jgi:hypothetical protein
VKLATDPVAAFTLSWTWRCVAARLAVIVTVPAATPFT